MREIANGLKVSFRSEVSYWVWGAVSVGKKPRSENRRTRVQILMEKTQV